jgi:single-strand DNA-binding protein
MNLNRATIIGNVTRDPELKTIPSGAHVASFGVATNQNWTDAQGEKKERVEFHNIIVWQKLADICAQYIKKGRKVYVEGRLQTRQWDGPDGAKHQRTEIIAENVIILDQPPAAAPAPAATPAARPAAPPPQDDHQEINVEDIPF